MMQEKDEKLVYSFMRIHKNKRRGFFFMLFPVYIILTIMLHYQISNEIFWQHIVVPVFSVSLIILFYPPVENWVYNAWQARAQKYERHYRD